MLSCAAGLEINCCLDSWKEDSSESEQGRNEFDDDSLQDSKSANSNVHFTLGEDGWEDEITPMPVLQKKIHKSSMSRCHSQDNNCASPFDREKDKDRSLFSQSKLSQSDSNLDGPSSVLKYSQIKKLPRELCSGPEDLKSVRKIEEQLRKNSDNSKMIRRISKDQPEEDPKFVFLKSYKDKEMMEDDKLLGYRQSREIAADDFRRKSDSRDGPIDGSSSNFRRTTSDDFRKLLGKEMVVVGDVKKMTTSSEDGRKATMSTAMTTTTTTTEDCKKILDKVRTDELMKSNNLLLNDEKDETYSTDSNSTAADETDTKKKKLKLFGNFRKNKLKLS
ncbi:hypothetical protein Phum_PHUM006720 [Pediculus humanus corporis]|uniref:Uncharacterized protein n=1 Tax=Pediculus humanus subsp. corporis TaxID=121224 RepID=E0V9A5_PEDHC|nr:uncharacterized protein Phum_PHUM006720 [Pediculus humanus corporis]EEB09961.1 hypothetical protein Phum_PHUM006720 [Pediculus humanus corporis]